MKTGDLIRRISIHPASSGHVSKPKTPGITNVCARVTFGHFWTHLPVKNDRNLNPSYFKISNWLCIQYGYESIPINTIFRGMNIHLPAIFMFTRGTRFWPTAIYWYHMAQNTYIIACFLYLRYLLSWPSGKSRPHLASALKWNIDRTRAAASKRTARTSHGKGTEEEVDPM